MIREVTIGAHNGYDVPAAEDGLLTDPPSRLLVVEVVDGKAALDFYENSGGIRARQAVRIGGSPRRVYAWHSTP